MRLKVIRKQKGLTLPQLSELSGVPRRTILDIEKGNNPKLSTLIKLADALDVSLDELCKNTPGYYMGFDRDNLLMYEARITKNGILKTRIWDCKKGEYSYQQNEGDKQVVLAKAKELSDVIIF